MKKIAVLVICITMAIMCSSCSYFVKENTAHKTSTVPEYLSDCDAQYNEKDDQVLVSFGLKDSAKKYIDSTGTAKIVITDKTKNKLYDDTISFDENDFSDFTSKLWDDTRYLCGLYIDTKDIAPSATDEGIVELSVSAGNDQAVFDPEKIDIFGLPTKDVNIQKPKLPKKVSYFDYDNKETIVSITDISFDTEVLLDEATVEAKITIKMLSNNLEKDDIFLIKCVLKDSKGVQVTAEEEYCDYIKNGESEYINVSFYDLDANEDYKLSFVDVNDSL